MCVVICRIVAPIVPRMWVGHVLDAVGDLVPHVGVGREHVRLQTKSHLICSVLFLAEAHKALESNQMCIMNVVQYEKLAAVTRAQLHETTPRVMAVLNPLRVVISGREFGTAADVLSVPDFPFDVTRGSHNVTVEKEVFIDRTDFRMEDAEDYFGLAPGKIVDLKYAFRIRCDSVEVNESGEPCTALEDSEDKPKGTVQWVVASSAIPVEVRLYGHLFTTEEPSDANWEAELNPESEVVVRTALVDPSLLRWAPVSSTWHPYAGDNWCNYPTYDNTHCIIDSLEHIDYSICTLEFETRTCRSLAAALGSSRREAFPVRTSGW